MRYSTRTLYALLLALSGVICTAIGFAGSDNRVLVLGLSLKLFAGIAYMVAKDKDNKDFLNKK